MKNIKTSKKIIRKVKEGVQVSGNYKLPQMKVQGIKVDKKL